MEDTTADDSGGTCPGWARLDWSAPTFVASSMHLRQDAL